jgi:hypothetical protein
LRSLREIGLLKVHIFVLRSDLIRDNAWVTLILEN